MDRSEPVLTDKQLETPHGAGPGRRFQRSSADPEADRRRAGKGATLEERIEIRAARYAFKALKRLDELSLNGQPEDKVRLEATVQLLRESKTVLDSSRVKSAAKRVGLDTVSHIRDSINLLGSSMYIDRDKAESLLRSRRLIPAVTSDIRPGVGVDRGHGPPRMGPIDSGDPLARTQDASHVDRLVETRQWMRGEQNPAPRPVESGEDAEAEADSTLPSQPTSVSASLERSDAVRSQSNTERERDASERHARE